MVRGDEFDEKFNIGMKGFAQNDYSKNAKAMASFWGFFGNLLLGSKMIVFVCVCLLLFFFWF